MMVANFYKVEGIDLRQKNPNAINVEGWNMVRDSLPDLSDEEWKLYEGVSGKDYQIIVFDPKEGTIAVMVGLYLHPNWRAVADADINGFLNTMPRTHVIAWRELEIPKVTL